MALLPINNMTFWKVNAILNSYCNKTKKQTFGDLLHSKPMYLCTHLPSWRSGLLFWNSILHFSRCGHRPNRKKNSDIKWPIFQIQLRIYFENNVGYIPLWSNFWRSLFYRVDISLAGNLGPASEILFHSLHWEAPAAIGCFTFQSSSAEDNSRSAKTIRHRLFTASFLWCHFHWMSSVNLGKNQSISTWVVNLKYPKIAFYFVPLSTFWWN